MLKNMTQGSPLRLIVGFSLPLIIGMVLQLFYGMTDTIIVGHILGWRALGAVGASGVTVFLLFSFIFSLTGGFAILTGQKFGAQDMAGVRRSMTTSLLLSTVTAIIVISAALLGLDNILTWLKTPAELYGWCREYLVIVIAGHLAIAVYNVFSSTLRALGDSKTPLYFLIVSTLLNIALDLLFLLKFHWGIQGVAYATVVSQLVSGILCAFYTLHHFPELRLSRADWKPYQVKEHLRLGIPLGIQSSCIAFSCVVMQGSLNTLGDVAVAGFATACQVDRLFTIFIYAVTTTVGAFAAQNFGSRRFDRICNGCTDASYFILALAVIGYVGTTTFYPAFTRIFVGKDQVEILLPYVRDFMYYRSPFYIFLGLMFIYRNALQSMGYSLLPLLSGFSDLVFRSVLCVALGRIWGYRGVCLGDVLSWVITCFLLGVPYFLTIRRRTGNFLRTPYRN